MDMWSLRTTCSRLTEHPPRFAPKLGDIATPLLASFREYVKQVSEGTYPAAEHGYQMPAEQKTLLAANLRNSALPNATVAK